LVAHSSKPTDHRISISLTCVLAIALLIVSGLGYRLLGSRLPHAPIALQLSLSNFPTQIDNWIGSDLPIPATTKEYMEKNFADDFISRRYINVTTKDWVDVYIVYCSSRPGGILGHRPGVCYPGNGWVHDSTELSQFISSGGRQIRCLVHRFHKPAPMDYQTVVLNFYILNGETTSDEDKFSGPFGRRPNIAGNPARYVAQVQISSVLESSVRTAAKEFTNLIIDFLPDENGEVKRAKNTNTIRSVLK